MEPSSVVVERAQGVCGELVLRRRGEHHEIVADGVFLMDTRGGASERLHVTAAADRMPLPGRMLVGGLGVGFSLAAALAHPGVTSVRVIERESAVLRWNRGPLAAVNGHALADPRVVAVEADVVQWIAAASPGCVDAVCLDVDNGPDWLVSGTNGWLYSDAGLTAAARVLAPGGMLSIWSAAPSGALLARMSAQLREVEVLEVPVGRGEPDVILLGRVP